LPEALAKLLLYLSGLGSHMPVHGVFLLLFTLANHAFPLFPNFAAELLCLVSLFPVHELLAYTYCVCGVLGAAYGFWALNKAVHGVPLLLAWANEGVWSNGVGGARPSGGPGVGHDRCSGGAPGGRPVRAHMPSDPSRVEFHMLLPLPVGVLWLGIKPLSLPALPGVERRQLHRQAPHPPRHDLLAASTPGPCLWRGVSFAAYSL
jgi:NADH:ubiquinone oxidoreductase subunit 4 (subunit M)